MLARLLDADADRVELGGVVVVDEVGAAAAVDDAAELALQPHGPARAALLVKRSVAVERDPHPSSCAVESSTSQA
jgi:hypothetical protein